MIEEGVAYGNTLVFRIDPRVKIITVFLFSCLVAVSYRFVVLEIALLISIGVLTASRVPARNVIKRLAAVNAFVAFLWFFLPFSVPGTPLTDIAGLVVTREGITYATQITMKSNAIMMLLIVLIYSTSILTLGHALHDLRMPRKIVHLLFFTYRYIHVIHREYVRLLNAMKIRGFHPRSNLHTYKTFAHLVGMLLVRSTDRAERVHRAMICRNFSGRLYSLKAFNLKGLDLWVLTITFTIITALGFLECMIIR